MPHSDPFFDQNFLKNGEFLSTEDELQILKKAKGSDTDKTHHSVQLEQSVTI